MPKITWTDMQLSKKVENIPEALSIYMNQLVYNYKKKEDDIVVMSLGEAYFDIPLFDFTKIDHVRGYHYSESRGLLELRKKICDFYRVQYGAEIDAEKEILISAGSKSLIFMAMQAVLNDGDEALLHEPAWLSYQEQIKLVGALPRFIPYHTDITGFDEYLSEKTRMLILNNPNNPAGWMYRKDDLENLYSILRPRGIYLLVDEAYSDFAIDQRFPSAMTLSPNKDGIIVINSLSKNMGISGWRIGYVMAAEIIIDHILKINQHLITCAASVLLLYLAEYFEDILGCTLPQVHDCVRKRQRIASYMDEIGLNYLPGASTFYFFISLHDFKDSSLDFALYLLLKHKIAVVPGSAYGQSTRSFVRISVGTESEERLRQALNTVKRVIDQCEVDKSYILDKLKENGWHYFQEAISRTGGR